MRRDIPTMTFIGCCVVKVSPVTNSRQSRVSLTSPLAAGNVARTVSADAVPAGCFGRRSIGVSYP